MSVVEQLIEMGFERQRAEKAFSVTKSTLEEAMEWLLAHEGEEIIATDTTEGDESSKMEGTGEVTAEIPGSYKCNDCNKLFRDENGMMFHASKSGHENFSESTESIKPLSEEEKKQKALELRDRIRAARAAKDEVERKEALEKEMKRREDGKKMLEMREKQKENEMKAIADARKREKLETEQARLRVLEQIRLDKEERAARLAGSQAPAPAPAPSVNPNPPPKTDYEHTTIQIRLKDGRAVRNTFGVNEQLSAVRLWLQINHVPEGQVNLMTPFPRKTFTADDFDLPLKELGLVPSASLVLQ